MPLVGQLASAFTFDAIPVATLLASVDGAIVAANAALARLAGVPADYLTGKPIRDLVPDLGARWAAVVARARREGEVHEETPFDGPRGRRVLQLAISILDGGPEPVVQAFAIDVTDRKASEDAARERVQAEEQHAAKQRLESLGLVAGGIAHDFNNLLVGVLAEASAAREDRNLADGTREALRRIEAAARRMAQLTRQLLAYAGRGQFVTSAVDPDELLGELRDQLTRIVRTEATLSLNPGAGAIVVEADPSLLRQVVVNLVANASDANGRHVDIATRIVQRDGTPWWQLEVGDDGAGIDAATMSRIFEPFFSTKVGRHGLGLSAVHGIVRRLGGDVEVDSRPGRGARFRVRLPVIPGAEPAPRRASEAMPAIPQLGGMRVLVVDDEPSVRATVRRLLERRGATVVVAADGLEAEARLRDEAFGLVISDVSMPGRSGHEVLAVARATQPHVPVILMSGYTERVRGEGGEEEPDEFLEKPFTAKILDAAIDDVLKKR